MLIGIIFCLSGALAANDAPLGEPSFQPSEVVRRAVAKEMEQSKTARFYMWMYRVQKPKGSQTKQLIETPEGIIGRLMAIGDKPLTPAQRKSDDDRINRLLDPEKMRAKAKQQREDEQHAQKLLRALPDAFVYEYTGSETSPQGHRVVSLSFSPNPNFHPAEYETQVYQGMKGQVWIDTEAMRLAKIEGTLFRDVNFGWGILGKLYKGGRFVVEQADVDGGHWEITRMNLNFDGKVMMVKSLHLTQTDTAWDFHPVPRMNVRQALEMLRKSGEQLASALSTGHMQAN